MSKLHAVGVGRSFNWFEKEDIEHISLKSSSRQVMVGSEIYDVEIGTSFEESQKIDNLLDRYGELKINDYAVESEVPELVNGDVKYVTNVLEGNFKFNKWYPFKNEPAVFEGRLADFDVNKFGQFGVYANFEDALRDNFDLEGDGVEDWQLRECFSDKRIFEEFKNSYLIYMDDINTIEFEDINEPVLIGQIKSMDGWWVEHFKPVHEIQDIDNIKGFINDVLKEQGQETHFTGVKNTIEVDKSEFEEGYEPKRSIILKNEHER